ncbi:unnamed protein product [Lampetra planeri]
MSSLDEVLVPALIGVTGFLGVFFVGFLILAEKFNWCNPDREVLSSLCDPEDADAVDPELVSPASTTVVALTRV